MVFGTFDHFHEGHRFLIREALKLGQVTVVVARTENVERIKGQKPDHTDAERTKEVQDAFPDVTVMLGNGTDFLEPLRIVKPDLLLFGYDQKLPPGVTETDLPCKVARAPAFKPELFKSSLMKKNRKEGD